MISEKIDTLRNNGRIHVFTNGDMNFIYSREKNLTHQVDDNLFSALQGIKTPENISSEEIQSLEELYYNIRHDLKPTISFYSLSILSINNVESNIEEIKEKILKYNQSEMIFSEAIDTFNEKIFFKIKSLLGDFHRSELIFIKEKKISNVSDIEMISSGSKISSIKQFYNVDLNSGISIKHQLRNFSGNVNGQLKLKYSFKVKGDLYELIQDENINNISFYIVDEENTNSFLTFLLTLLDRNEPIYQKVYNLYAIANYLVAKVVFNRTIEMYECNTFISINNSPICDRCWAKNICWATKSYSLFNVDLTKVNLHHNECNAIKCLIENVIIHLRKNEKNKVTNIPDTYDFDGFEIKLIN